MAEEKNNKNEDMQKKIEKLTDEELEAAGATPNKINCPAGQKRVGNKCVPNDA